MTLKTTTGDLFTHRGEAIGHGVNCIGKMGSGIAVQFKYRLPDMYRQYAELCSAGAENPLRPGMVFPFQQPNGRWVYNLATQNGVSRSTAQAKPEWITAAVQKMVVHAEENSVTDIGLPLIGGGLGGLTKTQALDAIEKGCADSAVNVTVYLR